MRETRSEAIFTAKVSNDATLATRQQINSNEMKIRLDYLDD